MAKTSSVFSKQNEILLGVVPLVAQGSALIKGSTIVDRIFFRRQGRYAIFRIDYAQAAGGTNGTLQYKINLAAYLPSLQIDLTAIQGYTGIDAGTNKSICGDLFVGRNGTQAMWGKFFVYDAQNVCMLCSASTATNNTYVIGGTTGSGSSEWFGMSNANQMYSGEFRVPIVGWSDLD